MTRMEGKVWAEEGMRGFIAFGMNMQKRVGVNFLHFIAHNALLCVNANFAFGFS